MKNILIDFAPIMSCSDLIQIFTFYRKARQQSLCKNLITKCKHYVVEDIDNLNIQQLLTVIQVYKHDP